MKKIGIICEYNPFHNGHLYHIEKIKEMFPDSLIILVLNGYFLQRGEVSILSKYDKCQIALENNVDLVIELPVLYGTQSADTFAYASIKYLEELKVDHIVFGSETNDINVLKDLANKQMDDTYNNDVKNMLKDGTNYPTALAKSLKTEFVFNPNDLLGISYIKAINKLHSNIDPITIQRTNDYHDTSSSELIISAKNIRNKIMNKENISKYLPGEENILNIDYDLYFNLLKTIIIRDEHLEDFLDVDEGIENRLKEQIVLSNSLSEFISNVKTKRYTYNKINRMLIHILLGIKKEDAKYEVDYMKIIGMNKKGKEYLNSVKKEIDISLKPIKNSKIYEYELKASLIYDLLTKENTNKKEISNKPIIY